MFVNALPLFIRQAIVYYQQASLNSSIQGGPDTNKSYIITYGLQIILGLLLMGNQRQIVSFTELRRRRSSSVKSSNDDEEETKNTD